MVLCGQGTNRHAQHSAGFSVVPARLKHLDTFILRATPVGNLEVIYCGLSEMVMMEMYLIIMNENNMTCHEPTERF